MTTSASFWDDFPIDPRDPGHAGLRATDADRDLVAQGLSEAFADGRLSREEHDDRSSALLGSRTLGELPPLMADLIASRAPVRRRDAGVPVSPDQLRARAVAAYESDRRDALLGFVGPSLVCVVIWAVLNWGTWDFFWPGFVMAGTLVNVLRVVVRRQDIVEDHLRSLQRKQDKAARKRELEPRSPEAEA